MHSVMVEYLPHPYLRSGDPIKGHHAHYDPNHVGRDSVRDKLKMGVEVPEERIHRKSDSPLDDVHQGNFKVLRLPPYDVTVYVSELQNHIVWNGVVLSELDQRLRCINELTEETHLFERKKG